ncbi:hypothetical protein KC19_4G184400 [Ceratodon purpureus]|uniref:Nodulin-like domain-containing protein n=1 Tax=Ceratodon purpureus TaxID=3225 RepID=A0A8T0IAY5_CERPU|nr:hypothetical protein KC19_4G184400 [Ceratodon purpureus]
MVRESTALVATKWVGLVAAIWVQASAGNAYMFAFYSPALKSVLHYNQLQLNNLGVAKDFGENVGLIAGLLCNKLPAWILLCTGALFGCVGYGTLWLVVSEQISPLPYWQMLVLQCIGSNSATWFNTAVLVTCMRNFPHSRGTVVGILKGFVGLSAAIFAQVYIALLAGNSTLLLLFLAVVPTAVCLASMLLVRPVPAVGNVRDSEERRNFNYITAVCVALAGYLLVITFIEELVDMEKYIPVVLTAVMVIFLVAPLAIPIKALSNECYGISPEDTSQAGMQEPLLKGECDSQTNTQPSNPPLMIREAATENAPTKEKSVQEIATSTQPDTGALDQEEKGKKVTQQEDVVEKLNQEEDDAETLLAVGEGAVKRSKRRPRRGEDFKLRQALVKADFWLLFLTFFCGVGTGVTVINNLGQIGEAQGYYNVNIFVSLISIANFLGRLGGGSLSEHYIRSDAIPRTVWMGVAQIVLIFVHLMFASALPGTLYVGSVLLGLCYGVHFSIMVPTASELFGLKHFGMIYNSLTIANPLGSFLFSGLIAGYLYDREAAKDSGSGTLTWGLGHSVVCTGAHCFRLTFYVMACVCSLGVVLTFVLTYRIRRVYIALYRKSPNPSASDLQSSE